MPDKIITTPQDSPRLNALQTCCVVALRGISLIYYGKMK